MDTELFPIPVSLSPRLAWLTRHGLTLTQRADGKFVCALDEMNKAVGEDGDEACVAFCLKTGLRHWNDGELRT